MKKVFSKVSEKLKAFFGEMTPGAKIRNIAIAAVVVVVALTVVIVGTAGSSKEPAENVSTEKATIEFEEEIIINFEDEELDESNSSSNVPATEQSEGGSSEDVTEEAESTDAADTEESTRDTESAPSEDTDATEPEETYAPVTDAPATQVPVTQAPVTQAPVTQAPVTQAPATQAPVTQAPVTQAPVTQAPVTQVPVTQAPVTQAPVTQAPVTLAPVTQPVTTKPSTNEPEESKNYGSWVIKQKKYYYDTPQYVVYQAGSEYPSGPTSAGNVMILQVENKSDEAFTITIDGKYLDASGNVITTESQTFKGFAANWSNYFVFAPGIEFDKFTFELSAKKYNAETYAQHLKIFDRCTVSIGWAMTDGSGREVYPTNNDEYNALTRVTSVAAGIHMRYKGPGNINYWGKLVFFDKNGELAYIRDGGHGNMTYDPSIPDDSVGGLGRPLFLTDVPYDEADSYKIPDNLTSITGIFAISEIGQM